MKVRVCFVCLGNICRSPTAEATMRWLIEEESLVGAIVVESAGTGGWHVGDPPDLRARAAAKDRGIDVRGRARQFLERDFGRFDYVVAMDRANREDLLRLAPNEDARGKVVLFRSFDDDAPPNAEVPDPYYGGEDGFAHVLEICEAAARGLLRHLRDRHVL
ncbi:MAG: low molecular weight protein-tyrosine-phosphatase [Polyangiales bacterium]